MSFDHETFPELPKSWVSITVQDACISISIKEKILTKSYLLKGNLAVVDQGYLLVGGFTDQIEKAVNTELPVIIFGDHTRAIKFVDFPFAAGADGIKILKTKPYFVAKLFYWFLKAIKLPDKGYARHFQYLRTSRIALPPLNEQKRIVDKLDCLLAKVDACRERCDRIPLILKRFRQSVLAAATSGELTEDWRVANNHQFEWRKVRISDIGQMGRGKSKHRPRNDLRLYDGIYPFIQTGDIAQSDGLIISHSQTYSEFGLSQSKLWPAGTVCITIAANIADTAILTYPACFPDSVVGFVADPEKCLPQFIKWSIDVIRDELESFAPATAQKNINLAVLNNIEFECPPLNEQQEIVRRVEILFAYADRLEVRYRKARAQVDHLTPALLDKAFRGELVPQDSNDEPASVLLEQARQSETETPSISFIKSRRTMSKRSQSLKTLHEQIYQQFKTKSFDADALSQLEGWDMETKREKLFQLLDQGVLTMSKKQGRDGYTLRCVNKPAEGHA